MNTLPSMALNVFSTNHYSSNTPIYNQNSYVDADIRNSYYGGIVDVYKPIQENGYYYDINSLYPYAMLSDMPIGLPYKISGKVEINESSFGFFYVNVTAPKGLNIPFLPYKTDEFTISPLGSWNGWYFSEEIKHAKSLGYIIKPLNKAYLFERGRPFDSYINTFYEVKRNTDDKTQRFLAKLFLNSFYGKFGQSKYNTELQQLNDEQFLEQCQTKELTELFTVDNYGLYVSKLNTLSKVFSNVAIASAVTAYSRIIIDYYKRIEGNECYYTDTDSVFLQKPLDDNHINNELGGMKLEAEVKKGVLISPKVYGYGKTTIKMKGFTLNKQLTLNEQESQSHEVWQNISPSYFGLRTDN